MAKILITGVNGFVGRHLVNELGQHGLSVVGIGGHSLPPLQSPHMSDYLALDLSDPGETQKINFGEIDGVIHLAGLAAVGPSFDDPMHYININIGIEVNLFEAALAQDAHPRFLIVSSGNFYDPAAGLPITEQSPLLPKSPYAVSKIGQEQMARYYSGRNFECIVARPFNHIGPGQGPGFIVPDIAQQIVACERGKSSEVRVGNLDSKRDYTDVRDIARAYRLLLDKGVPGETYNICSGNAVSGHDIVQGLLKAATVQPTIAQDPDKMRPSDNPIIYGSPDKLTQATGWQPEIPLETTLNDVIADWRSHSD